MSYNGGLIQKYYGKYGTTISIFNFLKEALKEVKPSRPFRGTELFKSKIYDMLVYFDESKGNIKSFKGVEKILLDNGKESHKIYELHYCGGIIIPESEDIPFLF